MSDPFLRQFTAVLYSTGGCRIYCIKKFVFTFPPNGRWLEIIFLFHKLTFCWKSLSSVFCFARLMVHTNRKWHKIFRFRQKKNKLMCYTPIIQTAMEGLKILVCELHKHKYCTRCIVPTFSCFFDDNEMYNDRKSW